METPHVKEDKSLSARIEKFVGFSHCFISDYPNALKFSLKSLEKYSELGDSINIGRVYSNLGVIYFYAGAYDLALHYNNKALALYSENNYKPGLAQVHLAIGNVYTEVHQPTQAIKFLKKSLDLSRETDQPHLELRGIQTVAEVQFYQKNYDKAIEYCEQCIPLLQPESHFDYYWVYLTMGKSLLNSERYDEAIDHINTAITSSQNLQNELNELSAKFYLAQTEFRQGHEDKSRLSLNELIDLAREKGYHVLEQQIIEFKLEFVADVGRTRELSMRLIEVQKNILSASEEKMRQAIELSESVSRFESSEVVRTIALEEQHDLIRQLDEVGRELSSVQSIREVNSIIRRSFGAIIPVESCSIGLYQSKENVLDFQSPIEKGNKMGSKTIAMDENDFPVLVFDLSREMLTKTKEEILHNVKFPDRYELDESEDAIQSIISIPLVQDDQNIGVLTIGTSQPNAYSKQDLNLVKNLASFVIVAIQNTRSYNNLSQLSEVGQEVLTQTTINGIVDLLHDRLAAFLDDSIFYIGLYNKIDDAVQLVRVYEHGEVSHEDFVLSGTTNSSIALYCARTNHTFIGGKFDDLKKYLPNYQHDNARGNAPESIIALPLVYQDEVKGVISVQSYKENAYRKEQLEIMKTIASFVSTTLHNISTTSTLRELSIVASKTDNAIIIADDEGNIEWVNEAFEKFTGKNLEKLSEEDRASIKKASSHEEINEILAKVITSQHSVNYESVMKDSNDNDKFIQTTLTPLVDDEGNVHKLIAVDSDITFQKKAELEIRAINKDITDSINYAKRIQTAMLPVDSYVRQLLPESFVFFEPKDIVSGDFYWMTMTESAEIVVAAVDCTGHGVPGAFLTIVGMNLLNQIVVHEKITDPGKILEEMNIRLLKRLASTSGANVQDGMDASICVFSPDDKDEVDIKFAGAFNPLYYVEGGEIKEVTANLCSIGTPYDGDPIKYDQHEISLPKGTMIYLFSDGYPDQLGGKKGKKFMKVRFRELLAEISNEPTNKQKDVLEKTNLDWRGEHQQIDDILIIGIKL